MKVFYYDDVDGRVSAALFTYPEWCLTKYDGNVQNEAERKTRIDEYMSRSLFVKCDYATNPINEEQIDNGEKVVILGLSISPKRVSKLKALCDKAGHVILIDTHKGSVDSMNKSLFSGISNLEYFVDEDASTSELTWNWLIGKKTSKLPSFLNYIKDHTKWTRLDPITDSFICGLQSMEGNYPWSDIYISLITDALIETSNYDMIDKFPKGAVNSRTAMQLILNGRLVHEYFSNVSEKYLQEYGFEDSSTFNGYRAKCLNWKTSSVIFETDLFKYDLCCVFAFNGKVWSYTIFSNKPSVDCAEIAKKFGGDGRTGVAGFSLPYCLFGKDTQPSKENK